MRTLVFQANIGNGVYMHRQTGQAFNDAISSHLIPTVQDWCKRHGYDHQLITESVGLHYFGSEDRNIQTEKYYYFEHEGYDQVICMDVDVYMSPDAGPLPIIKGMAGHIEDNEKVANKFLVSHPDKDFKSINGGIIMSDGDTATEFVNFFKEMVRTGRRIAGKQSSQGIINEFLHDRKHILTYLDRKWNYIPRDHEEMFPEDVNVTHLAGLESKARYMKMLENGEI